MTKSSPSRPELPLRAGCKFGLVVSRYNGEFTSALAESAISELIALAPDAEIIRFDVPGAFEIPLAVETVADAGKVDAILALGVIIAGETAHAGLIASAITNALMETGIRYRIPVIHEVLLVANADQAKVRCSDSKINRGTEAARAAVAMMQTMESIQSR